MVVFYDSGVVPVPVMRPVSDVVGPQYPDVPAPTEIDRLVVKKLRKLGIVPSELCSDTEFLRRASLDVTGTLPTAKEVAAFLADKSPDKRHEQVDELLARPTLRRLVDHAALRHHRQQRPGAGEHLRPSISGPARNGTTGC